MAPVPDGKTGVGTEPYLSLVVTARNDDHGGNLIGRMQVFVHGWIEQARRYGIPSELIVVEWNPPADRPHLVEALRWPKDFGPCTVRIIEVPEALHRRYYHASALPLYQMIAKNVGIRRSRGRFVLATNIDILFSNELAAFLAKQALKPGHMYRIDRHDCMSDVPSEASLEEQLAYCQTHLIRINRREGTFPVSPDGTCALSPDDVASPGAGIFFGRGWFPAERSASREPFRLAREGSELLLNSPDAATALVVDLEPGPGAAGAPLDLEALTDSGEPLARILIDRRSEWRIPLSHPVPDRLWLQARCRGSCIGTDPRVLSLRAFRVDWERGGETAAGGGMRRDGPKPVWRLRRIAGMWAALQWLIEKLAREGPLVKVTVPVSPYLAALLRAYVDRGGFTGMARSAWRGKWRRGSGVVRPRGDISSAWSGVTPGAGWRTVENAGGRDFRQAFSGAELIVTSSAAASSELELRVEAAGELGQRPLELCLLDAGGQLVARHPLDGLSVVRFSLPPSPRCTRVFRLELHDAPDPVEVPASSRVLNVYSCNRVCDHSASGSAAHLPEPWGSGWRLDRTTGAVIASNCAEIILPPYPEAERPFSIDLETTSPTHFEIRDGAGRLLAEFAGEGRELRRLSLSLEPGRTHVLQLSASETFRAYSCGSASAPGSGSPAFLHTNGCGDFTLLAREHWIDLRGYPEFDAFSMNLDSVFCFAAHYGGAPELMLHDPRRIYHIEHGTGSGWTPEGQGKLFERIAAKGLSFVPNDEVLAWAAQMNRLDAPMIFNHEDWGLSRFSLKETELSGPPGP